jgi:aminopeptidase N
MERISGKDLKMFFNGWFNSHLLPDVKVSHNVQKNEDGYLLELEFIQRQGNFVFPLWLEWREKGQKITKKVIIQRMTEEFEFQLREEPERIKVNPDKAVPGKFS